MNALPRIEHDGIEYFVDLRLSEIRPINEPWNPTKFHEIEDDELYDKVDEIYVNQLFTQE